MARTSSVKKSPAKPRSAKAAAPRRVQARTLETRRRILDAAAKEFSEKGFEGGSSRNIAAAAGVKHPLVTYHFKTKEGLWQAVLKDLNERFSEKFNARLSGLRGVDDVTTLRLMLEEFIYFSNEHPEFHWLMSNAAREHTPRLEWLCREFIQHNFQQMTSLIDVAQQQGRFVPGDPGHLFYVFIGAVTRIYMVAPEVKIVSGRSTDEPGFLQRHAQLCLSLFFREAVRDPAPRAPSVNS